MRKLSPTFIATSVVIALAGATAQAQTSSAARGTPPSATVTTTSPSSPSTLSPSGTAGSTSGTSISGTSSGDAFSGSSRGNAPPVGAAAGGNNTMTNPNATLGIAPGVQFNANGERIGLINPDTGLVVTDTGTGTPSGNTVDTTTASGNASTTPGVTTSPELDRATRREAQHARKTVERKGQMLESITPRTNVDRTDQMPDDSTPLLSPARR
jgi:hypothetical protein